jgi:hypothetical protein
MVALACQYPGCTTGGPVERCSNSDGRLACPAHRTLRNGAFVCAMCDAEAAPQGAWPSTHMAGEAQRRHDQSRQPWLFWGCIASAIWGVLCLLDAILYADDPNYAWSQGNDPMVVGLGLVLVGGFLVVAAPWALADAGGFRHAVYDRKAGPRKFLYWLAAMFGLVFGVGIVLLIILGVARVFGSTGGMLKDPNAGPQWLPPDQPGQPNWQPGAPPANASPGWTAPPPPVAPAGPPAVAPPGWSTPQVVAPVRGGVNPMLVVAAGLVVVAMVAAFVVVNNGKPGGGITISPSTLSCNSPVAFTVTVHLPASVHATDLITVRLDGKTTASAQLSDAGSTTQQADGSWLIVTTYSVDDMRAACAAGSPVGEVNLFSPGTHTMQVLDASGRVLAQGSYGGGSSWPGASPIAWSPTSSMSPGASPIAWSPTGSMSAARVDHTATLLSDGRVLIAGGQDANVAIVASAELYDPKSGTFSATGPMTTARVADTATLLSDGRVLIAGGYNGSSDYNGSNHLSSAELYDPKSGTFSPTGPLTTAREHHTATLLSDGWVLLAGGVDASHKDLASAELYDPKTGTFSPTGSMATARVGPTATLLSDGRVLIAGGENLSSNQLASAELYDPKTGTFSPTGSMTTSRYNHTATRLADGRVLIAGGYNGSYHQSSAELYDPKSGTFSPTGSMAVGREYHTATLLSDGRVLVAGGEDVREASVASAELYDPKSGTFSPTGSMTTARDGHTATLLSDGRVLVTGGWFLASAELWQP